MRKNKIKKEIPDENCNNKRAKIKHYEKWIEKVGNQFYSLKEETLEIIEELKKENQTLKKILTKSEEELKWKNHTLEEVFSTGEKYGKLLTKKNISAERRK